MRMVELVIGKDYYCKPPKDAVPQPRYTGRLIVMAKQDERPTEKGKTRTIPCALEYNGHDIVEDVRRENRYVEGQGWVPTEIPYFRFDYDSKRETRWQLVQFPINRIIRDWDEYQEELEIEEEIRRAAMTKAQLEAEERRKRIEEERERQQEVMRQRQAEERKRREEVQGENQKRVDAVKSWLDEFFPTHEVRLSVNEYGISIDAHAVGRLEWWETLIRSVMARTGDE